LKSFGWLRTTQTHTLTLESAEVIIALRRFQLFAGIRVTGKLDAATLHIMSLPRCGGSDMKDVERDSDSFEPNIQAHLTRRAKRYILQGTQSKYTYLTLVL